jgi:primosomal protein N' (replication factor Y) (superfamily II helicase)
MPGLVEVAPLPPVPLHDLLTYEVPPALSAGVRPGVRVRIPLGRQVRTGVVTAFAATPPVREMRSILEVLDADPFLTPELLELARWAARYYLAPLADVLAAVVPAHLPAAPRERIARLMRRLDADALATLERRAPAQARAYRALARDGELAIADAPSAGIRPASLRALVAAGLAEIEARERATAVTTDATATTPPALSAAQRAAVAAVVAALDADAHSSFLLHGVTGSGKTEVFLAAAEHALGRGRGALLLVPEIALTHQLLDRVRGRLGNTVAVLHSALGPRERWAEWRRIRSGEARAVVGARSALFAPVARLGLVVVDEEHDAAYKQEDGFRYNARDLAVVRARLAGGVVVLASATPSAESYHAALDGRHALLALPERPTPQPLPPVTLVDLRNRPRGAAPRLLTDELRHALEANLARGGQTLVFLNRRGYATYLQCPVCGNALECPHCSVTLTWHRGARAVACHHCQYRRAAPSSCPSCAGTALEPYGVGTEQIEAALRACYPLANVDRLDRDAARRAGAQRRILHDWLTGDTDILVGTQMVGKGHDVPGVTLVAVLLADLSLNLPDFRAAERTLQLLVQVAGRAGRGDAPGTVCVQTFRPEHPSLVAAATHDYTGFMRAELERRRVLGYPPYSRLVSLRLDARDANAVESRAQALAGTLRARASALGLEPGAVLGPAAPPIERLRGRHRRQILLRNADVRALRALARHARAEEHALRRAHVRLAIDVDPYSML